MRFGARKIAKHLGLKEHIKEEIVNRVESYIETRKTRKTIHLDDEGKKYYIIQEQDKIEVGEYNLSTKKEGNSNKRPRT